ncbi:hypothetical protein E8E14_004371 [Neopestalotiopsis sp. 37M]|nr:hypothetical protein E8E14_004371 [Neopestalotiopsis sp. 37M]
MARKNKHAATCIYCGRVGHNEARCYHAHPELAPPTWRTSRPGQGQRQKGHNQQGHSRGPRSSRGQWEVKPNSKGAPAVEVKATTTNNQSGSLDAVTSHLKTLSITGHSQNKPFRLLDFPIELVEQVFGHCDVLALIRLLRTSKLTKDLVERLDRFSQNMEEIHTKFTILSNLQRAVQKSKDHREWSLPIDLSNWNYADVLSSFESESCPTCPARLGLKVTNLLKDEAEPKFVHTWRKVVNATNGKCICDDCFFNAPAYRLAYDVEQVKEAEESLDWRPDVGLAKNYLGNLVCCHGARLTGCQAIFLSREGGPTFAWIARNLWAKVRPFYDGYDDARNEEGYYAAEGCRKHPYNCVEGPSDIRAYDPKDI